MNFLEMMPLNYKKEAEATVELAKKIFKINLINITLGGSGGKGNIIDKWSDLDFYIILKRYDIKEVSKFMKEIDKFDIHVGTTFYTKYEIQNNIIDNKTKITLYERQNYKVNPILFGEDIFNEIPYQVVKENDLNNFPNILHDFRRRFVELNYSDKNVDKTYIKKMLVLTKCLLSHYDIFSYGYEKTFNRLDDLFYEKKFLTEKRHFDIFEVIKNIDDSKKLVLDYSDLILNFIDNIMFKEEVMEKRISSRAVIIDGDSLLTMFRRKKKDDGFFKEYYVIPGGGLEDGETLEENVIRELKEEFNVDIEVLGYLGKEEHEKSIEHYFHGKIINGIPCLGGEELERMTEDNYYEVRKIALADLENTDINAKDKIAKALNNEYEEL